MSSSRRRRIVGAVIAAGLVACSSTTPVDTTAGPRDAAGSAEDPPASDAPSSEAPASEAPADPPASPADPPASPADPPASPADPPTTDAPACEPDIDAAVDATITGQLAAFAADDYAAALGFASRDFQASTDVASFRRLIDEAYPEVSDSVGHRVAGCLLVADDVAHAVVTVTGRDGGRVELLYVLVAEPDVDTSRWAVAAAASRPTEPGIRA